MGGGSQCASKQCNLLLSLMALDRLGSDCYLNYISIIDLGYKTLDPIRLSHNISNPHISCTWGSPKRLLKTYLKLHQLTTDPSLVALYEISRGLHGPFLEASSNPGAQFSCQSQRCPWCSPSDRPCPSAPPCHPAVGMPHGWVQGQRTGACRGLAGSQEGSGLDWAACLLK